MLPIKVLTTVVILLVLGVPRAHGLYTKYCAKFTAKKTNDANKYYCSCKFIMCPAEYAYIDGCENNSGKQLIRLFDDEGIQWTSSQSYRSTCGYGAEIRNFNARITICQQYTVHIGCVGRTACGGRIRIRVSNTTFPVALSSTRTPNLRRQNVANSLEEGSFDDEDEEVEIETSPESHRALGDTSTGLGTAGYCDDATSLTLGAIVALIVVPFLCCCACCVIGHRLLVNRKTMQVVPEDDRNGQPPSPRNSFNYFLQIPLVPAMFVTTYSQPQTSSTGPSTSMPLSSAPETATTAVAASIVPTAYAYVRPSSGSGRSFNMSNRRAYAFLPTLSTHPSATTATNPVESQTTMATPDNMNTAPMTTDPVYSISRASPSGDQPSPRTVIVSSSTEADNSGSGGVQSSRSTNANSPYQSGTSNSESLDATIDLAALRIPPLSTTSSSTARSPSSATVSSPSSVSVPPGRTRLPVRQRSIPVVSPRYAVTCPTADSPEQLASSSSLINAQEQALFVSSLEDETDL